MAEWHDLFVMIGGAAAALTGLLFVSMSLQLRAIADHPARRARARTTLAGFVTILIVTIIGLLPALRSVIGQLLIVFSGGVALIFTLTLLATLRVAPPGTFRGPLRTRAVVTLALVLCLAIAGALLIAENELGLYVLTADLALLMLFMIMNTWALLVGEFDASSPRAQ